MGALDFAGGTVVHVNAAVTALVAALVVGPRHDYGRQAMLPHSVPFVLLGAGLLWFGWLGFNGGSALAANTTAALAAVNTVIAPCGTVLVWLALDRLRTGRMTAVGVATALVVGLVAITPAAGFVGPMAALAVGALTAPLSYYGLVWRARTRLDDSLDVTPAHGLGGVAGALLTGVFAAAVWGGTDGLLTGQPAQLARQAAGAGATIGYAAAMSWILLRLVNLVVPLRSRDRDEAVGLDVTQHGEEAYSTGEGALLLLAEKREETR
jgi:Amt family ammonium transporter